MNRKKSNTYNDLEDELLQRAFDAEEDLPLPEDYIIDELNDQSVEFLKTVQKERKILDSKHPNTINSIELEYSLNVDNSFSFHERYNKLKIYNDWINEIKYEFELTQEYLRINHPKLMNNKKHLNMNDIISKYNLHKENLNLGNFPIPTNLIKSEIAPHITNKLCMNLINHFHNLFNQEKNNEHLYYSIMLWIYFFLAMLETPLVDDDNSLLYGLNKNILKILLPKENIVTANIISLKIIHVIISEIFGQKIINLIM